MDSLVKERSSNFSVEEIEKLKILIEKHKNVVLCNKTDAITVHAKVLAWNDIYRTFNCDAGIYRSKKQLKYKFDNLKKTARKERRRTAEGRPDIPPASPNAGDWTPSIIVKTADGLEAEYDDTTEPIWKGKDDTILNSTTDQTSQTTDISETIDVLPVFDSGAPASLLRYPASPPLKRPRERATVTPQSLKKSFKDFNKKRNVLNNMRQNMLDGANEREEREHRLRLKHNEDLHVQALRHNEEKHAAELCILKLRAQLLEMEIEKFNK